MSGFRRIVYIEDDPTSRHVFDIIMRVGFGIHDVVLLETSAELVDRLVALDPLPDVVFTDLYVTPHNGFEVLKLIRSDPRIAALPVAILTATTNDARWEEILRAGFDGGISKPLDKAQLDEFLGRLAAGETPWFVR